MKKSCPPRGPRSATDGSSGTLPSPKRGEERKGEGGLVDTVAHRLKRCAHSQHPPPRLERQLQIHLRPGIVHMIIAFSRGWCEGMTGWVRGSGHRVPRRTMVQAHR